MGFFILFTGNFFYFLFINSSKEKDFVSQMKIIYGIVTICKNALLCIAFLSYEKSEIDKELQIPNEIDLDGFTLKNNLN